MFLGEYRHVFDDKGRIALPVRFREALGPRLVLTRGLERCLVVYGVEEWEKLAAALRALPYTKGDVRAFLRYLFAGAVELEPDRQGRIAVPPALRSHAGLEEREAVFVGVSERVEIWAPGEWERYLDGFAGSIATLAEKLSDMGLFP